jgi:uncharacterized protein YndB with AHSA1/START domain
MDKTLKVEAPGEREIVMTRGFAAPRKLVFEAFIKPELVRQWLLGPEGWTMPECEIDARPGGRYRYVWQRGETKMGMGGVYREVAPPEKLVATEKFDEAWYPGEAVVTTTFTAESGGTQVVMTVLYDSREARDMALKSGMESGVAVSYDRLEKIVTGAAVRTA